LEAKIGAVGPGTPAAYVDLRAGDLITAINGRRDVDFGDLAATVILTDPGDPIVLEVERDGQRLEKTLYSVSDPASGVNVLGIPPYQTLTIGEIVRFSVEKNGEGDEEEARSPSEEAGLAPGWTLMAFNGAPLESWYDYERMVIRNGLEPYTVTAVKDGVEKTFTVTPVRSPHPFLGIAPAAVDVSKVTDGSLAHEMGLAAGDRVVGLGDMLTASGLEVQYALARKLKDPPPLIIERAGRRLELVWSRRPRDTAEFITGFELVPETRISGILSLSAAEMLGMQPGDVVLAVDGREVREFEELRSALAESEGDTIAVKWSRDGAEYDGSFSPVFPDMVGRAEERLWKLGFFGACRVGTRKALDFASQVYRIITKIITGQRGIARNIGGPITIARASYTIAAQRSPTEFMLFLAIISINLGVVNLLPIPILDGGLLVVFIIEKLKGSPISVKTQVAIQYMGLAIIVLIFVFVTYQDILRFFR
ncbi:MAG: PDZ domain-containing protein, partial [Planctomycetota bacterium]